MANKEQEYEPQAKPVDEVTKPCQEFIRLYPTRWTLTDSAFEKIKNTGILPKLPEGIARANNDYDLRRLRDGYVYILAAKAECENFKITWEADNGEAWYMYSYINKDNTQGFSQWGKDDFEELINREMQEKPSPNDVSTKQETANIDSNTNSNNEAVNEKKIEEHKIEEYQDIGEVKVSPGGQEYIELNRAIETVYIMYSEFKLPYKFLKALEKDPLLRFFWMKKIQIKSDSKSTIDISKVESIVGDFLPNANYIRNNLSNLYRFAKIGKSDLWKLHSLQLASSEGVIVALDDPIGIARDLDCYVYYLDDKRQEVLAKYEYAFTTAQVIDAHAKSILAKEQDNQPVHYYYMPLENISEVYNQRLQRVIAPSHLNNSEDNIVNILKNELGITGKVSGVNTINKIANMPNLFNTNINNVVISQFDFIHQNIHQIRTLSELYQRTKDEGIGSAFCQYFGSLIEHINFTSLGQQVLIAALDVNNTILNATQKNTTQKIANKFKDPLGHFKNFLSALAGMGSFYRFNLYSFDRIVQVISNEVVLAGSYRQNGKRYYKRTEIMRNIERVYRKTGVFGQEELLSEEKIFSHAKKLKASRKKLTVEELNPVRTELPVSLKVDDTDFKRVTGLSSTLDGAAKFFAFSAILGFFTEDSSYTKEGRWANNAAFATLLALAEKVAPGSNLDFALRNTGNQRISLAAINKATGSTFSSSWQAARAGLFNFSTALAGVSVLIEAANAHEAKYKGDEMDYWGAVSRGTGSGLMALSPAALGTALTMMASTSAKVAFAGAALRVVAMALPYVGAVLLLIGIGLALFKKSDMELWIKHSFWGDSDNYWGKAVGAYGWAESRPKDFKLDTFDKSKEIISNKNIYNYYKVEMQRLFSITKKIKLEAIDKHRILVTHPNINTLDIAKKIRVNYKSITIRRSPFLEVLSEPQIIFNENESGQVILYFKDWFIRDSLSGNRLLVNDNEIERIKLQVSIPRYDQATEDVKSDTAILDIKGK